MKREVVFFWGGEGVGKESIKTIGGVSCALCAMRVFERAVSFAHVTEVREHGGDHNQTLTSNPPSLTPSLQTIHILYSACRALGSLRARDGVRQAADAAARGEGGCRCHGRSGCDARIAAVRRGGEPVAVAQEPHWQCDCGSYGLWWHFRRRILRVELRPGVAKVI